jgi:hypothetical protein
MAKKITRLNPEREEIRRLRDALRKSELPKVGMLPTGLTLKRLQEKWLPAGSFVCRNQKENCDSPCHDNRCDAGYWLKHSEVVAALMRNMADMLGNDPDLYQAAGQVHDLDYVKAPHDLGCKDISKAHPVALVKDLMEMGAPPILSLAVLEHSPHLNLEPSSPLSDALVACDDAATLASTGYDLSRVSGLPPEIIARISTVPRGTVGGKYRRGMPNRMVRAFKSLYTRNYYFTDVS